VATAIWKGEETHLRVEVLGAVDRAVAHELEELGVCLQRMQLVANEQGRRHQRRGAEISAERGFKSGASIEAGVL